MKNGWTGGQYSLFRVILAIVLLGQFLRRIPWRLDGLSPIAWLGFLVAGALCVFLAIGLFDRAAALGLCCLGAYFLGRELFLTDIGTLGLGWLLLTHVFLPPAPYGSWAARGRVDPGGGWRMPPALFAAVWIMLAMSYGLLFIHPFLFTPLQFTEMSLAMMMLHLLAFDPGWIRPKGAKTERIFYDGYCGLCQRSVRLILAEDRTGTAFRFAPLQGETFASLVSAKERAELPLSLVVQTEQGVLLTRSAGVLHILRRLGGVWRVLAGVLVLLPVRLRDRLYDGVARVRHRVFARPSEACPLMPPALRVRFDP